MYLCKPCCGNLAMKDDMASAYLEREMIKKKLAHNIKQSLLFCSSFRE